MNPLDQYLQNSSIQLWHSLIKFQNTTKKEKHPKKDAFSLLTNQKFVTTLLFKVTTLFKSLFAVT